jgi:predicted DNA-binding WGR domain protein
MRIYLQLPAADARALRYYQLILEPDLLGGWTLVREWGQQGGSSRIKRDFFPEWEQAEAALVQARDVQIAKGFRVVFAQGQRP